MKSDTQLMQDFQNGDIEAFESLVSRHHVGVFNFFSRMHGNVAEAEDQTQDVFLKVFRSASGYQPSAKFTTYLYRIARNAWIDWVRKRARRGVPERLDNNTPDTPQLQERLADPIRTPLEHAMNNEAEKRIQQAIEELPEHLRMVFVLAEIQKMRYADVGETLEIPVGTVKSRMHSAVVKLRETLHDLADVV